MANRNTNTYNNRFIRNTLIGALALFCLSASFAASAATLTDNQRRAYLYYYAPLIMKRSSENSTNTAGYDWITNYDFDRDGVFGNNSDSWDDYVRIYSSDASDLNVAKWKIRPTLYTALIEFQDNGNKSLVLLYHVYHALEQGSIHDWERVEVRIDKASGTPGGGDETVRYLVLTEHSDHVGLLSPSGQFTPKTATGHHPIVWQAKWQDGSKPDKNQLNRVTSGWTAIDKAVKGNCGAATCPATVPVTSYNTQPVHYVFVPEGDVQQVAYWGAVPLTAANSASQAAKTSATLDSWSKVKRITYELQDLADIIPTHAVVTPCTGKAAVTEHGWKTYEKHWDIKKDDVDILMESAVKSETGVELVPASSLCNQNIRYIRYSLNDPDNAQGYPYKHWFWGAYKMNGEGDTDKAFEGKPTVAASTGNTQKRVCPGGAKKFWCQHDYYVHTGDTKAATHGRWLSGDWYTAAKSGFDGRWVQLFPDNY